MSAWRANTCGYLDPDESRNSCVQLSLSCRVERKGAARLHPPIFLMSCLFPPGCRLLVAFLLVFLFHPLLRAAQGPEPATTTSLAPSPASPPPVTSPATATEQPTFYSPRTVLWTGRPAVIPLRTTQATADDQIYPLDVSESGVLEILRQPTVLEGQTRGYLRVRALRAGRVRLSFTDGAALDVEVRADPFAASFAQVDAESPRPRVVTPEPDTVVWGDFAVGVDVFDAGNTPGEGLPEVQLRLPGGRLLDPVAHTDPATGPTLHYQFIVSADDLPTGPAKLVAVSSPAGFTDVDRLAKTPGSLLESDPLPLRAERPGADALWSGRCTDPAIMGTTKDLYAPGRPPRFGTRQPAVAKDPAATGGEMIACYGNDPAWVLPFDAKSAGEYQFVIRARGDMGGNAYPTVGITINNADAPVKTVRLSGAKYHRTPLGSPFHLDAGWQMLTVRFTNDFSAAKEDRNLYLDDYEIARVGDLPPASGLNTAPIGTGAPVNLAAAAATAGASASAAAAASLSSTDGTVAAYRPAVLYPANGAHVFGADAVIARVTGGDRLVPPAWVDVLLDGEPQGVRSVSPVGTDAILLPLVLRQVSPGSHHLSVRVADTAGHTVDSPAQLLNVLPAAPAVRGPYERAIFLLDRLAFGPDPRELTAVLTLGETVWLNNRLNAAFDSPTDQALLRLACTKYPRIDDENQGASRALAQWIGTDNPVRARFTAWAENHFSTWINKTRAAPKWHEHLDFCRLGVAPFADLLSVSSHSPAMLVYLDQEKSYAGKLNENYAREVMELHTLGVHAGYAQTDVTALAGVLNGWTLASEATLPQTDAPLSLVYNTNNEYGHTDFFHFVPALNDGKERRVFGLDFPAAPDPAARYDRVRLAMEMLASHPGTAEHVSRKLAEHYVGVPAPDPLVHTLAQTFLDTGGDMRAMLRTLAASNAFWSAPPKMATPFDYGLRIARLSRASVLELGAPPDQALRPDQIAGFLKKSGMGLFDRVTPDGYPENSADYIDSNALLQRWHFMEGNLEVINRLVPNVWRKPPVPTPAKVANEILTNFPPAPEDPAQRFIDLAAIRLTGRLLSPASNQAALGILAEGTPDQMKQAILFVSLLPETSLR